MASAAHSPLPWRVDPKFDHDIQSVNGLELTTCFDVTDVGQPMEGVGPCPSIQESLANAAFIVRACNAHYQMLEALKTAQAALSMMVNPHVIGNTSSGQAWATCFEADVKARAAIAAAEAEAGR